jgi:6-phosphogluconolactonase (cycloisomerase 2 family)
MALRLDRTDSLPHLLIVAVIVAISCAVSSHAQNQRFVYVGNWDPSAESISGFSADPATGLLTPLSGFPVKTHGQPLTLAAHPNNRFLYASNENIGQIDAYSIDPTTGGLTPLQGSPFSTGLGSFRLTMHPSGRFLYLCTLNNKVYGYTVDANTGVLKDVPGSPFQSQGRVGPDEPGAVITDPAGKFLFVANIRSNTETVYSIDPTTGTLAFVPGSPFSTGNQPSIGTVDPNGRFFYISNLYSNDISAYTISSNGALTAISGSPFPTGPYPGLHQGYPTTVAVDRNSKFAYAMNEIASTIAIYKIDPSTGALAPIAGSPFPTGSVVGPYAFEFSPEGNFAYISFEQTGNLALYSINPTTGELTQIPGAIFPTGAQPISIAIVNGGPPPVISPDHGGNTGAVTVQISGIDAFATLQIKLSATGQPDLIPTASTSISSSILSVTFDLTGASAGIRDLVLTTPGQPAQTFPSVFTVQQGGSPQIQVNILGPNKVRIGREETFYLAITNTGNTDADPGIASLAIPGNIEYTQLSGNGLYVASTTPDSVLLISSPSSVTSLTPQATAPSASAATQSLLFATQGLPPGSTQYAPVRLTLPSGLPPSFTITAAWQQNITNLSVDDVLGLEGIPFLPLQVACIQCSSQYLAQLQAWEQTSRAYLALGRAERDLELARVKVYSTIGVTTVLALGTIPLDPVLAVPLTTLFSQANNCVQYDFATAQGQGCLGALTVILNSALNRAQAYTKVQNLILARAAGDLVSSISNALTAISAAGGVIDAYGAKQAALAKFQQSLGPYILTRSAYENCTNLPANVSSCKNSVQPPPVLPAISSTIQGVTSLDPNGKFGRTGVGQGQYLYGKQSLTYEITFENSDSATASAQTVTVNDILNSANVDLSSLILGPVSFDGDVIVPPSIPLLAAPFTATVDLRPGNNLLVQLNASLNPATSTITWAFASIDPSTGKPTTDSSAGFLAPASSGSISFSVMPASNLATGTMIHNKATIIFDTNAPIDTPVWSNTIDNTHPISSILSLAPIQTTTSFNVQWAGTDAESGVRTYTIYVSDNGGPFVAWLTNSNATQAIYPGAVGHTYAFFSIATDKVGNMEAAKASAEATTSLVQDTTPPVITPTIAGTLGQNGWYRSAVTISWSVTDPESGIVSSSGCSRTTLTADTTGVTITCTATNGAGLSNSAAVTIKIDQTPPVISGMPLQGCSLWPPNQKLVKAATINATDALSGLAPGTFKVSGASNEPSDSKITEIVIAPSGSDDFSVQLRADRLGTGNGRVYTLNATATDLAGNSSTATAMCAVPHDHGN